MQIYRYILLICFSNVFSLSPIEKIAQRKRITKSQLQLRVLFSDLARLPHDLQNEIKQYVGPSDYTQWQWLLSWLEKIPIDQQQYELSSSYIEMNCIALNNDSTLVVGSNSFVVSKYDIERNSVTVENRNLQANCLCKLQDESVAVGHSEITILRNNLDPVKPRLKGHPDTFITCLLQMRNGVLISGGHDHKVKVWDMNTFECIEELKFHKGPITALVEFSDGWLACGSQDKAVSIWDMENYTLARSHILDAPVSSILQLSNGKLAIGLTNSTIIVWDFDNQVIGNFGSQNQEDLEFIHQLLMSDNVLFSLTEEHDDSASTLCRPPYVFKLKVWDVTSKKLIREVKSKFHNNMLAACLLGNKKVIIGHEDGRISTLNCQPYLNACSDAQGMLIKASVFDIIYLNMIQALWKKNILLEEAQKSLGKNSALVSFLRGLKQKLPESSSCTVQ